MNTPTPSILYATLSGQVDPAMVQRVFNGFNAAVSQGVQTVHLVVHSTGGFIADGIAIYNYLRAIPINLITYNIGVVASIAVVVFLGGKERKASANANFMIHKAGHSPPPGTNAQRLKDIARGLLADDARLEAIFKSEMRLSRAQWATHSRTELNLDAKSALAAGLIHSIDNWAPPPGTKLFTV